MKIFVQLPAHISISDWQLRYAQGKIIGLNDSKSPYGYSRLEKFGKNVKFSDKPKNILLCRLVRKVFGFDLWNVISNRKKILDSDVIWTHTEYEYLAIALLLIITRKKNKLLGQNIWLVDKWPNINFFKKWLYIYLIKRVDILTFHSPLNAYQAKNYFNRLETEVVKFGIPNEEIYPVVDNYQNGILKIVAIGNDIHRDWKYLISCCQGKLNVHLTIVSTTINRDLIEDNSNVTITSFANKSDFISYIRECDISIVPLTKNFHASGLTAIQESILFGLPILCSNYGGLDYYFNDDSVNFFTNNLSKMIDDVSFNYSNYREKAIYAQRYLLESDINADDYIKSQLRLSSDCMNREV